MTMFYKSFLVVFLVFLLSDSLDGQRHKKFYREDYTYIDTVENFYKFHSKEMTWIDAKRVCALEGASFFYPETDDEANAVGLFWNSTQSSTSYIHVGMSDLLALGVYATTDGKLLPEVFRNWRASEPNNGGGTLRCIVMASNPEIIVASCTSERPFICKKSLQSLQWNYCCDTYDLDYNVNKDTGNCYKLHTTPLNWTDAYAACRAEQSHLAVINSQGEVDYLVKLTEPASKQKVEGNYFRGIFHLGFHNITHDGWRTVKGTPMNEDLNSWWGFSEPEGRDQCGSMFYNGRLGNVNCDTKSFFICEHEVGYPNSSLLETNHF